jgi:hypothetical protein
VHDGFSAKPNGVGLVAAAEELRMMREREKAAGIEPDWEINAFLAAETLQGKRCNIASEYILRLLGLEICADTIVGNEMMRGISGGQKKRVTTGVCICICRYICLSVCFAATFRALSAKTPPSSLTERALRVACAGEHIVGPKKTLFMDEISTGELGTQWLRARVSEARGRGFDSLNAQGCIHHTFCHAFFKTKALTS